MKNSHINEWLLIKILKRILFVINQNVFQIILTFSHLVLLIISCYSFENTMFIILYFRF